MTAVNVDVTPIRAAPLGGAGLKGTRLVFVEVAKATQNDTCTLQGVKELVAVVGGSVLASNGAITAETYTAVLSTKVITLTSSAVGTAKLLCLVR
jgi:hypothetical protein